MAMEASENIWGSCEHFTSLQFKSNDKKMCKLYMFLYDNGEKTCRKTAQ